MDAPLPVTAAALADGLLSPAHLDVLVSAMASLPAEAEQILVDVARSAEPAGVRTVAAGIQALPTEAGERPHVTVTMDYQTLVSGIGTATLGDTTVISAAEARRIACTAGIIPVVLGERGEVLDIGRMSRRLTSHLRNALRMRDAGCAFPGCDRPPNWTDAHHLQEWQHGGHTALDNLVLLCRHHHTLIHRSEWEIQMVDGFPCFYPPAFIDPQRRPLRNQIRRLAS